MKVQTSKIMPKEAIVPESFKKIAPQIDVSFKSVYDQLIKGPLAHNLNLDLQSAQINKIMTSLQGSRSIAPKDLLLIQLQIGAINMKVELLSKAADSALSLTRKLQNAQ